jgi:hypothetical protein
MSRLRFCPLAALAGLVLVFTSCERHHVGELPEVQREHLHPIQDPTGESMRGLPTPPTAVSPTPANFFPKQQP